jgi:hypothetical protein
MGAMIRMEWTRYPDGFKVVDCAPLGLRLEPVRPERREPYLLEGIRKRVSLHLANVNSVDDAVAFTNDWGRLEHEQPSGYPLDVRYVAGLAGHFAAGGHFNPVGEELQEEVAAVLKAEFLAITTSVDHVQDRAALMRLVIKHSQSEGDVVFLDELLARYATPRRTRWARLVGDSVPRLFVEPDNLFAFCLVELAQIASVEIRSCPRCGQFFALGKVGKPKRYCKPACKVATHYKEKKAKKAKQEREQHTSNVVRLRALGGR